MTGRSSTAQLVGAYARDFVRTHAEEPATSPLGAWILAALSAPAASGARRRSLERVLGTDVDTAHARASELLQHVHPAVHAGVAVWANASWTNERWSNWSATLPRRTTTGPIPDQQGADQWARSATNGMVERFPVPIGDMAALVVANAVSTEVSWTEPYSVVDAHHLAGGAGGPLAGHVRHCLHHHDFTTAIVATDTAGSVAAHVAHSKEGVDVISVIAAPDVEPGRVHAAALDIAEWHCDGALHRHTIPLARLELGDGHSWTVEERTGSRDYTQAYLPAWRAEAPSFDLRATAGYPEVLGSFLELLHLADSAEARQTVVASYDAVGFRASSVTGAVMMVSGLPKQRTVRRLTVRFNRPYAVVAVTAFDMARLPPVAVPDLVRLGKAWHGIPLFGAWVTAATEPAPVDGS